MHRAARLGGLVGSEGSEVTGSWPTLVVRGSRCTVTALTRKPSERVRTLRNYIPRRLSRRDTKYTDLTVHTNTHIYIYVIIRIHFVELKSIKLISTRLLRLSKKSYVYFVLSSSNLSRN